MVTSAECVTLAGGGALGSDRNSTEELREIRSVLSMNTTNTGDWLVVQVLLGLYRSLFHGKTELI